MEFRASSRILWIRLLLIFISFGRVSMEQDENQLMLDMILKSLDRSQCPGTVLAVSGNEWTDQFILRYGWPIVMFQEDSLQHYKWPDKESICSDAVLFQPVELLPVYRQLDKHYFLNQVIIVTNLTDRIETLLDEVKSERLYILLEQPGNLEMLRWSVSHKHILRLPVVNNFSSLEHLDQLADRLKFSGRHLKLATLHYPPAVFVRLNQSGSSRIEGMEPSLISLIAQQLNFTYDHVLARADEMWGEIVTDQSGHLVGFTGIRGMLARREVDLAFGDMYMNPSWFPYISFSQVYKTDYDCFIVPAPRPLANWMALILPFTLPTWMATLASIVLVTAVLRLADGQGSTFLSLLYVLGQLLWVQQPLSSGRTSSSGRVFVVLSWLSAATILSTVYRSGLISFLTSPFIPHPVDTIQQLVESPLNKIMFADLYQKVLLNSTDVYRRQLGQQLFTTHNISQMFTLLDTGQWAVDSSIDNLRYVLASGAHQERDFHVMREQLFPTRSSFGLQLNSPLKMQTDRVIQRLVESGLVEYHRFVNYADITSVQRKRVDGHVRFSLHNLQGAFYLLAIGVLVSTLVFLMELFWSRCRYTNVINW